MDANLHNFLMKNKGPSVLKFVNGQGMKYNKKYYELQYDHYDDIKTTLRAILVSDLQVKTQVVGSTLFIWE
jgi:hypothetical protein